MPLPRVFVGSSTKALAVARAIQANLADAADIVIWNEGMVELSQHLMESLTQAAGKFDFAVLVMAPDDDLVSAGQNWRATRDNVLIELGLFIGTLGRERTFLVVESVPELKIPSDLEGMVFARYRTPADDRPLRSALGPACEEVRDAISKRGRAATLKQLEGMVHSLVRYSMSASILRHLFGLALLHDYKYRHSSNNARELYFLRDHGLIRPKGQEFLDFDASRDGENLAQSAEPTPAGWDAIKLRRAEIPQDWLSQERRDNLRVDPLVWA
jgi:Predicted nucleotide-binding protein containing TIR-like domain